MKGIKAQREAAANKLNTRFKGADHIFTEAVFFSPGIVKVCFEQGGPPMVVGLLREIIEQGLQHERARIQSYEEALNTLRIWEKDPDAREPSACVAARLMGSAGPLAKLLCTALALAGNDQSFDRLCDAVRKQLGRGPRARNEEAIALINFFADYDCDTLAALHIYQVLSTYADQAAQEPKRRRGAKRKAA